MVARNMAGNEGFMRAIDINQMPKRFWGYAIMGRDILDKNTVGLALPSFQSVLDEIHEIAPDTAFSGVCIWSYRVEDA